MVLVGDKEYDQGHVVKVLCKVIAGLGAYALAFCMLVWCGVEACGLVCLPVPAGRVVTN